MFSKDLDQLAKSVFAVSLKKPKAKTQTGYILNGCKIFYGLFLSSVDSRSAVVCYWAKKNVYFLLVNCQGGVR